MKDKCMKYCGSISLTHFDAWRFCSSKWLPIKVYLFYRFIFAFYPLCWIIYSLTLAGGEPLKWFIYLQNWFSLLLLLYFQISWWLAFLRLIQSERYTLTRSELVFIEKYVWTCFNVLVAVAPTLITVFFWFIYPYDGFNFQSEFVTIHEFFIAPCMIILDIFISSMPLRLAHIYCPLVWGLSYIIFIIGYELGGFTSTDGGYYVYPALSFRSNAGLAVGYCMASLAILSAYYILCYVVVIVRDTFVDTLCSRSKTYKFLFVDDNK